MSLIPVNLNNVMLSLQNDAQQWRITIEWAKQRYQAYNQNLSADVMTGLGISSQDQGFIEAFVGDLNRFIQLSEGTVPSSADDMVFNLQGVLGVM